MKKNLLKCLLIVSTLLFAAGKAVGCEPQATAVVVGKAFEVEGDMVVVSNATPWMVEVFQGGGPLVVLNQGIHFKVELVAQHCVLVHDQTIALKPLGTNTVEKLTFKVKGVYFQGNAQHTRALTEGRDYQVSLSQRVYTITLCDAIDRSHGFKT